MASRRHGIAESGQIDCACAGIEDRARHIGRVAASRGARVDDARVSECSRIGQCARIIQRDQPCARIAEETGVGERAVHIQADKARVGKTVVCGERGALGASAQTLGNGAIENDGAEAVVGEKASDAGCAVIRDTQASAIDVGKSSGNRQRAAAIDAEITAAVTKAAVIGKRAGSCLCIQGGQRAALEEDNAGVIESPRIVQGTEVVEIDFPAVGKTAIRIENASLWGGSAGGLIQTDETVYVIRKEPRHRRAAVIGQVKKRAGIGEGAVVNVENTLAVEAD